MSEVYNHHAVEPKWQKYWETHETFKTDVWDFSKPKYYALDMFPYPSGVGLHAGHPEGYTATDIMSRMKRMQGYNVLHPMGYDSFGLPAEQYAVTTGNHPAGFTEKNIQTFSKQLKELGFDYDWSKLIATSDPKFYKWTQWIFKKLYEAGYAKHIDMPVNWCEELGTVLSNDEVIDGKSERGGYPVVKKMMKQWVIDQQAFAEELLDGLNEIDWPESTKEIQRNWIGKSTGVEVDFKIVGGGQFSIFTTCIETIYGITFMVLAPDGDIVKSLMDRVENPKEVQAYIDETLKKNDLDRTDLNKTKSGCPLKGIYAINPVNGKEVPLFIGDFVLASYGTGAVMAVPTHDQRDFEYAQVHGLPLIQVINNTEGTIDVSGHAFEKTDYLGKGCILMNSEEFNGMTVEDAKKAITKKLVDMGVAREKVNYHFREWIFARQRYWGEPVPCVYKEDGSIQFLDDSELPVVLPELEDYKGHGGKAPLENATEWKQYDKNGLKGIRETSTMPGSAGSSWYYLRYMDPENDKRSIGENFAKGLVCKSASVESQEVTEEDLQDQVEYLEGEIERVADMFSTDEAEGESIDIDDSAEYYFKSVGVEGQTSQESTEGRQLFDMNSVKKHGAFSSYTQTINNNVLNFKAIATGGAQYSETFVKNVDATKTYILGFKAKKVVKGTDGSPHILVRVYGSNDDETYTTEYKQNKELIGEPKLGRHGRKIIITDIATLKREKFQFQLVRLKYRH